MSPVYCFYQRLSVFCFLHTFSVYCHKDSDNTNKKMVSFKTKLSVKIKTFRYHRYLWYLFSPALPATALPAACLDTEFLLQSSPPLTLQSPCTDSWPWGRLVWGSPFVGRPNGTNKITISYLRKQLSVSPFVRLLPFLLCAFVCSSRFLSSPKKACVAC